MTPDPEEARRREEDEETTAALAWSADQYEETYVKGDQGIVDDLFVDLFDQGDTIDDAGLF